jgi:DNA primase (bacterial type)
MQRMNCEEAKKIDIVEYISSLGFFPKKIRGNDYWFLSPFRNEKEASFKVNKKFNVWFDHGLGKGGNLVDFGVLFYNVSY